MYSSSLTSSVTRVQPTFIRLILKKKNEISYHKICFLNVDIGKNDDRFSERCVFAVFDDFENSVDPGLKLAPDFGIEGG